jgi:hypothetical protein
MAIHQNPPPGSVAVYALGARQHEGDSMKSRRQAFAHKTAMLLVDYKPDHRVPSLREYTPEMQDHDLRAPHTPFDFVTPIRLDQGLQSMSIQRRGVLRSEDGCDIGHVSAIENDREDEE